MSRTTADLRELLEVCFGDIPKILAASIVDRLHEHAGVWNQKYPCE